MGRSVRILPAVYLRLRRLAATATPALGLANHLSGTVTTRLTSSQKCRSASFIEVPLYQPDIPGAVKIIPGGPVARFKALALLTITRTVRGEDRTRREQNRRCSVGGCLPASGFQFPSGRTGCLLIANPGCQNIAMIHIPGFSVIPADNGLDTKLRVTLLGIRIAQSHDVRYDDIPIGHEHGTSVVPTPVVKHLHLAPGGTIVFGDRDPQPFKMIEVSIPYIPEGRIQVRQVATIFPLRARTGHTSTAPPTPQVEPSGRLRHSGTVIESLHVRPSSVLDRTYVLGMSLR